MNRSFFDTNILVYAQDARDRRKQRIAQKLLVDHIAAGECVISTQVINELCAVSLSKMKLDPQTVRQRVLLLRRIPTVAVTTEITLAALDLMTAHHLSYWDALMLEAARIGGCHVMYSEDLQHGASIAGVRITNPFVSEAREPRATYGVEPVRDRKRAAAKKQRKTGTARG